MVEQTCHRQGPSLEGILLGLVIFWIDLIEVNFAQVALAGQRTPKNALVELRLIETESVVATIQRFDRADHLPFTLSGRLMTMAGIHSLARNGRAVGDLQIPQIFLTHA